MERSVNIMEYKILLEDVDSLIKTMGLGLGLRLVLQVILSIVSLKNIGIRLENISIDLLSSLM